MNNRNLVSYLLVVVAVGCGGSVVTQGNAGGDGGAGKGGTIHGDGSGPGGYGAYGGYGGTHVDGAGPGGSGGTHTGGTAGWAGQGGMDGAGAWGGWGGGDGTGGYAGAPGSLGAKCKTDADCGSLLCIPDISTEFFGGGPAHGYCSKDCTSFLHGGVGVDPCSLVDPNSLCSAAGDDPNDPATRGFCLEGCSQGPPMDSGGFGKFDPKKCHGRRDVACTVVDGGSLSLCLPTCARDADCTGGRKCDPRKGVCVDQPTPGSAMGAHCHDDGGPIGCAGLCLQVVKGDDASSNDPNNIAGFCSQRCVYGDVTSCGVEQTPSAGICILAMPEAGNGDEAFCAQMCDVDADCLDQDDNAMCDTSYTQSLGRGLCLWLYGHK
ncbi:MAG: hypothetical protein HY898_11235 [Deltaproteobacteria bacterium]|nr:hypothetical protein [Deltaproteobacteria bacterium]